MRLSRRRQSTSAAPRRAASAASSVCVVVPLAALVMALGAGCGGGPDEASPTPATPLPDDLCVTVPAQFESAYALSATDHATSPAGDGQRATCTLRGEAGSQPVTLTLEVTSFAQAGDQSPAERATTAMAERCRELRSGDLPEVEVQENRCVATSAEDPAGGAGVARPGGHVVDVSRLPREGAVLVVDLDAPGQPTDQVEYDVTGLATAYLSDGLLG